MSFSSAYRWVLTFGALALLSFSTMNNAVAQITCDGDVKVRTIYMEQPFDAFHRIVLYGNLNWGGKISLDANPRDVNLFGDRTTAGGPLTIQDVVFAGIYETDLSGTGRRLYEVRGARSNLPLSGKLFLMVYPNESGPHRFVYERTPGPGVGHRIAVTLEPIRTHIHHACWGDWACH